MFCEKHKTCFSGSGKKKLPKRSIVVMEGLKPENQCGSIDIVDMGTGMKVRTKGAKCPWP